MGIWLDGGKNDHLNSLCPVPAWLIPAAQPPKKKRGTVAPTTAEPVENMVLGYDVLTVKHLSCIKQCSGAGDADAHEEALAIIAEAADEPEKKMDAAGDALMQSSEEQGPWIKFEFLAPFLKPSHEVCLPSSFDKQEAPGKNKAFSETVWPVSGIVHRKCHRVITNHHITI